MGYRTNEDKRGHLRTPFKRGCFSTFICPGFQKESNMDRWIYVTESGRKESGFENLKTRFQDCNLSRKQESKPDGMIERKQACNRESKRSAKKTSCLCGMNENKKARKKTTCLCRKIARNKEREKEVIPAFELSTWHERKPSVNLYGWNEIKMYHKKELLQ